MTLEYLDMNFCLKVTFFTFATLYATNTIKNNVANTIKAELDRAESISVNNYDAIVKEIGIITKCIIFVKILGLVAATHLIITLYTYLYTNLDPSFLTNNPIGRCKVISFLYKGSEPIFLSFFVLCVIITIICFVVVLASPRQNLLTAKWHMSA